MVKGIAWFLLALFGAYVAFRYYSVRVQVERKTANTIIAPPGVNFFCNQPVTHRFQQTQAYQMCNPCQVTDSGYAAAFGPNENMPNRVFTLEI